MTTRPGLREALRSYPPFAALDEPALDVLAHGARLLHLPPGGAAFRRGEPADRFFVVYGGRINLVLHSRGGEEKLVDTLRAGHGYAEGLLFDDAPTYPLGGIAADEATLVAVPATAYRAALGGNPAACLRLITEMSRRMHVLVREVESHALSDVRTRVVRHLLELAGHAPGAAAAVVVLPEPKQRIAARLGVAPETLSRAFRQLGEAGLLAVSGRTVRINDLDGLRAVA